MTEKSHSSRERLAPEDPEAVAAGSLLPSSDSRPPTAEAAGPVLEVGPDPDASCGPSQWRIVFRTGATPE